MNASTAPADGPRSLFPAWQGKTLGRLALCRASRAAQRFKAGGRDPAVSSTYESYVPYGPNLGTCHGTMEGRTIFSFVASTLEGCDSLQPRATVDHNARYCTHAAIVTVLRELPARTDRPA